MSHALPTIAVLGAGPIGLESALYGRFLGYEVQVYEREEVGHHISQWGHVHWFTPFGMNHSPLSAAAIEAQDPDRKLPGDEEQLTGGEYVDQFLRPLARTDLLAPSIHPQMEVVSIGRVDSSKADFGGQGQRDESPFRLLLRDKQGKESVAEADVVIDATGVYGEHRNLGRSGLPAVGEQAVADAINYRIPQISNGGLSKYAGRHTLVVGGGYSAATSICALAELAEREPDTRITWVVRHPRGETGPMRCVPEDPLKHRAALSAAANKWVGCGEMIKYFPGKSVEAVYHKDKQTPFEVVLEGRDGEKDVARIGCDFILGHTGFRPDCSIFEELQVQLCHVTEGPIRLASHLLNTRGSDCLSQTMPATDRLQTSEPDFYIAGIKSYGRDPTFLLSIGLEQIRQIFALISGNPALNIYQSIKSNFS